MAIARPIRMLGAACILLCLFLVFQLNQSSSEEGTKLTHGMKKDPLVDRAYPPASGHTSYRNHLPCAMLTIHSSDRRACWKLMASRRT